MNKVKINGCGYVTPPKTAILPDEGAVAPPTTAQMPPESETLTLSDSERCASQSPHDGKPQLSH